MDKSRSSSSSKHTKKRLKKISKKSKRHRRSPSYYEDEQNSKYDKLRSSKEANKLVEYSDVSSEDFSAPEAGEIQDEENLVGFCDRDGINRNNGSTSKHYGVSSANIKNDGSSTPTQRKIIVGSPISSSLSSHSPSQHDDGEQIFRNLFLSKT